MPIYEFGCPECGERAEFMLPMSEYDSSQECPKCTSLMKRVISLPNKAIIRTTGNDQVLADLNSKNDGRGNYPHHKAAMWKGLNQRPQPVGRGFG